MFHAVPVVFSVLCSHHSDWLILVCWLSSSSFSPVSWPKGVTDLCFCCLLSRNPPVLSFFYSHKMSICFSSICPPFQLFWLIVFLAGAVVIEAAQAWTFNSLFTGAPAAFCYQNYFVQAKIPHSMYRNLLLSLRKETCSCTCVHCCLLRNTYSETQVEKEKRYPLADWGDNLVDSWKDIDTSTMRWSGQHPHLAERSQPLLGSHPFLIVLNAQAAKQWD